MEAERLRAIVESMLFAAGEPVSLTQLANALDSVPREEIRKTLAEMMRAYADGARGIMLEEIAGGYQLRTPREYASYVRRLLAAKPPRLSRPLLETLAIIAYRQPITRAEIEQLRGVDTGGVLETLGERDLIKIAGRKEAPGRPIMYATTAAFLEVFGLKDLDSLPDLEEFRALEMPRELQSNPPSGDAEPTAEQMPADQPLEPAGAGPGASAERNAAEDTGAEPAATSAPELFKAMEGERSESVSATITPEDSAQLDTQGSGQPGDVEDLQKAASAQSRDDEES
ncbi:MAG: SMC-Scp complex subunit ScpB [Candidatus Binataceae bacterium]